MLKIFWLTNILEDANKKGEEEEAKKAAAVQAAATTTAASAVTSTATTTSSASTSGTPVSLAFSFSKFWDKLFREISMQQLNISGSGSGHWVGLYIYPLTLRPSPIIPTIFLPYQKSDQSG